MENNQLKIVAEAECNVLSIALHEPTAADEIFSMLDVNDFIDAKNRIVFQHVKELMTARSAIDITTVANSLLKDDALNQVGGIEYLTFLFENYISDANLEDYLRIVVNNTMMRQLYTVVQRVEKELKNNSPIHEVVAMAEKEILEVNNSRQKNPFKQTSEIVKEAIKKIEQLASSDNLITGNASGFAELDRITSGFQPGDFVILAARPSMGKTALALNFAFNSSVENSKGVAVFSVEMPAEQLVFRMLGSISQIDSSKIRSGKGLTDQDWKKLSKAGDKLKHAQIFIDDTPGLSVMELQSKLRKLSREQEIGLVVIDYLQLLTTTAVSGNGGESRQQEVSTISRQLKALARELNVPIICLSQLSRSVEKREDKKPIMSDLRDSGAIEQDADIIMFLYREEYYDIANSTPESKENQIADLILAKHRNGPTGVVKLLFVQKYGVFEDYV